MGRPLKDKFSKRSKSLRLRLTPSEHAWLKVMSKETKKNMREILWDAFQEKMRGMQGSDPDHFCEMNVKVVQEMKDNK